MENSLFNFHHLEQLASENCLSQYDWFLNAFHADVYQGAADTTEWEVWRLQ